MGVKSLPWAINTKRGRVSSLIFLEIWAKVINFMRLSHFYQIPMSKMFCLTADYQVITSFSSHILKSEDKFFGNLHWFQASNMGRVRKNTIEKAARVIIEKYYTKLTLDFKTNKRIIKEIATIHSKTLRIRIASFITHLMKNTDYGRPMKAYY